MNQHNERWRPVSGYEHRYAVSSLGRVWSNTNYKASPTGGLLSLCAGPNGYQLVVLYNGDGSKKTQYVHTLVLETFVGPRPAGYEARHLDGDRTHNHADNLRWGTSSDNNLDIVRHGRHNEASKTHCVNGHAFTADNILRRKSQPNARLCRECKRVNSQRRYERLAAGLPPLPVGRPKKGST